MTDQPTAYWDYIRIEDLLSLQAGLAREETELDNDEVLFITIHQIEELWFKLALRELIAARDLFAGKFVPDEILAKVVRSLDRITKILEFAGHHFALMETMTTRDYLSFRGKLYPASGFQSAQLREVEIILGLETEERIPLGHETYLQALHTHDGKESPASRRVEARLNDPPSLRLALDEWIYRTPIEGSRPDDEGDEAIVMDFIQRYSAVGSAEARKLGERAASFALNQKDSERLLKRYADEAKGAQDHLLALDVPEAERPKKRRIRAALLFIESYRELPLLAWPRAVLDAIVALEQGFVIFRQRHARMVERVIGNRTGTGGSAGVAYLDRTALEYRIFKDIWATKTLLIREEALPELRNPESYGFRASK